MNSLVVLWLRPIVREIYAGSHVYAFTITPYWFPIAIGFTFISIGCVIFSHPGFRIPYFAKCIWAGLFTFGLIYLALSLQDLVADF